MQKAGRKTKTLALEITAGDSFPLSLKYGTGTDLTGFAFKIQFGDLILQSNGPNPRVSINTVTPSVTPNTVAWMLTPNETTALNDGSSWSFTQTSPGGDVWTLVAGPLDIKR